MIGSQDIAELLNRQIKSLARRLEEVGMDDMELPNITITISSLPFKPKSTKNQIINPKPIKLPENVVEPETSIKKSSHEIIFTLKLPGVKNKDDINLQVFSNSVEIRALAGDKGYFKIISIPPHYSLVDKRFENEELILHFNMF
jgi:HSP20 family molecular chaperone IbpA